MNYLLICTVGGSPEPIVAALKYWRPARILFLHTPQTMAEVEEKIVPKARQEGMDIDHGRYRRILLPDGQDLTSCLERLRQLTPEVQEWAAREVNCKVVVDFTGGTKCMSAALAVQASHWPCQFSYVGGRERTKGNFGVVVAGSEIIIHQVNPWDTLGHQAVEDYVVLFDQHAFRSAADLAAHTMKRVTQPDRKRELAVLEQLAGAFDAWDRFDHRQSKSLLDNVAKSANDLRGALGQARADAALLLLRNLRDHLGAVSTAAPPSRHHLLDLLANAMRRKEEGRFDDAVARLYRVTEAIAQVALKDRHRIEGTAAVPLDAVPAALRAEWAPRAKRGVVSLGLQDAFRLLASLGDETALEFQRAGLAGETSPLAARNQSILAHGFDRVSPNVYSTLWTITLSLAQVEEGDLPVFPKLGAPAGFP